MITASGGPRTQGYGITPKKIKFFKEKIDKNVKK
jgi:hypothetical protein